MNQKILASILVLGLLMVGCAKDTSPRSSTSAPEEVPTQSNAAPQKESPPDSKPTATWASGELPQFAAPAKGTPIVTLHTSMGDVKIMLFPQAAPLSVENFVTHCKDGYYDGVLFHRVISDFMVQSGSPKGDGISGESIWNAPFADEFSDNLYNFRGALSMANSNDPASGRYGTNGSQFFIVQTGPAKVGFTADQDVGVMGALLQAREVYGGYMKLYEKAKTPSSEQEMNEYISTLNAELSSRLATGLTDVDRATFQPVVEKYRAVGGAPSLDFRHTVFGQVMEGMDIVDAISAVDVVDDGSGNVTRPKTDVVIRSTTVETAQ
ncbi:MAG: peptidylprolyl isomerase [Oscillospiraceae bacterium]